MRRQFHLPKADNDFLNACGLEWEAISEGGVQWLLLHGLSVPRGYSQTTVIAAIHIAPGYPDVPLDMVWFYPALARTDGVAIGALSTQMIGGKSFQRWSRHRTAENPWRPGEDDLSTHFLLANEWLEREFRS